MMVVILTQKKRLRNMGSGIEYEQPYYVNYESEWKKLIY